MFVSQTVIDFDNMWEAAGLLVRSDNVLYKWLGVQLSVGCRMAEVALDSVKFSVVGATSDIMSQLGTTADIDLGATVDGGNADTPPDAGDDAIKQVGAVKCNTDVVVIKPIVGGTPVADVLAAIGAVRAFVGADGVGSPKDLNKYCKRLCHAMRYLFPEEEEQMNANGVQFGTHFLRACYANLAWKQNAKRLQCTRTRFVMDVLGHASASAAQSAYQCVTVSKSTRHTRKPRRVPLSKTAQSLTGMQYADDLTGPPRASTSAGHGDTTSSDSEFSETESGSDSDSDMDDAAVGATRKRARDHDAAAAAGTAAKKRKPSPLDATFILPDGRVVVVPKVPYARNATVAVNSARADEARARLVANGVQVTHNNIWKLGVSIKAMAAHHDMSAALSAPEALAVVAEA